MMSEFVVLVGWWFGSVFIGLVFFGLWLMVIVWLVFCLVVWGCCFLVIVLCVCGCLGCLVL